MQQLNEYFLCTKQVAEGIIMCVATLKSTYLFYRNSM